MSEAIGAWVQFAACAAAIAFAGTKLCRYADFIAEELGLSRGWVGLVLLATVTSLPELVTGIVSVTAAGAPELAVGNVLGSCLFNLATLAVVLIASHRAPSTGPAGAAHVLSAAFGIVLLGFAGLVIIAGRSGAGLALAHVGIATPIILVFYAVAVRTLSATSRDPLPAPARGARELTLRQASVRYALASLLVLAAGSWLPFAATAVADAMGWQATFMGTVFVSAATTLPELTVTVAALRIGAVDMAIGNLLGSNLFDIAILAVDDVFYTAGALLSAVSPLNAASALSAVMMSSIAIVAIQGGAGALRRRAALAMLGIYALNTALLYWLAG